eukprot:3479807-Rhodomonas_salina.1
MRAANGPGTHWSGAPTPGTCPEITAPHSAAMRLVGPANTRRTGFAPSLLFSNTRVTIARCPSATGGSRAA